MYLGETVRFLLVLRCRDGAATPTDHSPGKEGLGWGAESPENANQTGSSSNDPSAFIYFYRVGFVLTQPKAV